MMEEFFLKADNDGSYKLNFEEFKAFNDNRDKEAEKFKVLFEEDIENLEIENLAIDLPYIEMDSSRIVRNEEWIKIVNKDVYIEEALYIIKDMVELHGALAELENLKD